MSLQPQDDWQQLSQAWQALPVDELRLRRGTKWKTLRMWANAALEIGVIFFVWGMTYWLWDDVGTSVVWRSWLVVWSVLTPIFVYWSFRHKSGLWQPADQSVLGLLHLQQQRAVSSQRFAGYSIVVMFIAIVMVWLWGGAAHWLEAGQAHFDVARNFEAVLLTTLWLLIGAACTEWYRRRQQRKHQEVGRILAQLESPEKAPR